MGSGGTYYRLSPRSEFVRRVPNHAVQAAPTYTRLSLNIYSNRPSVGWRRSRPLTRARASGSAADAVDLMGDEIISGFLADMLNVPCLTPNLSFRPGCFTGDHL
jgi:hypothetical protein